MVISVFAVLLLVRLDIQRYQIVSNFPNLQKYKSDFQPFRSYSFGKCICSNSSTSLTEVSTWVNPGTNGQAYVW